VIQKQEHEMCKTNVITNFYYPNICEHEHEKNMTKLWCKIVPKSGVEQIERNEVLTFIYTPLGTQFKEASKEASMCPSSKKTF